MLECYYQKIGNYLLRHPLICRALLLLSKLLPIIMGAGYMGMLAWLCFCRDSRLWQAALMPLLALFAGTWLRQWLNWPRPYEHMEIQPVVKKEKPGLSFPSRHSVSAFAIAWACWQVCPAWGYGMFIAATLVALTRVLLLVHHVRDVLAGALLSLAVGWMFAALCRFFA